MTKNQSAALALKAIRSANGISLREMARRLGMAPSTYAHYEDPERFKSASLPMDMAVRIAREMEGEAAQNDVIRLAIPSETTPYLPRIGEKEGFERLIESLEMKKAPERVEAGEMAPPDTTLVSVYDVSASAGPGALVPEYEGVAHNLAFPAEYLKRITSTKPDNLAIITVHGDSMTPTLDDDDVVMLDMSKTSLSYEGLFVIRIDEALQVKRLSHARSGHVYVISDNREKYPPREHPKEDVQVVGKVLWSGGKIS